MRVGPAANFSRATAVVVRTVIAINPVAKNLIVVIEPVLLTLDGGCDLSLFPGPVEDRMRLLVRILPDEAHSR
ncbi:hypothetical protein BKD09_11355 [Bradyrhizobium japonicum]|uniref:Uncharacterized protein n=1 Tax=Bradyrhizobium japonicum TaxID=375 RepID=A0A1L3F6L9_BRAJP|nr:hypothetical protein BKD09_11355 [Bradyrhizobium japonicum]